MTEREILAALVKLGTDVVYLNGRYELSKESYAELRRLVKAGMEVLKPKESPPRDVVEGPNSCTTYSRSRGGYCMVVKGHACDHVFPCDVPRTQPTAPLWNGYMGEDVVVAARGRFGAACYDFAFSEGVMWDHVGLRKQWNVLHEEDEEELRKVGLRRPDEPDYKPLGGKS